MRRILRFFTVLALVIVPFGSGAVWADQHEEKSSSKASSSSQESATGIADSTATPATQKAKNKAPAGPVNINTASLEELQTLPNIGPKKARAILDYRKENGNFKSVDDLKGVPGIGDKIFAELKQFLTL